MRKNNVKQPNSVVGWKKQKTIKTIFYQKFISNYVLLKF